MSELQVMPVNNASVTRFPDGRYTLEFIGIDIHGKPYTNCVTSDSPDEIARQLARLMDGQSKDIQEAVFNGLLDHPDDFTGVEQENDEDETELH